MSRVTAQEFVSGRKLNGLAPNEPLTEDRAALDFAKLYSDRLRYCHTSGSWFEWDGQLWRRDLTGAALLYARELSRELAGTETDRVRVNAGKTGFAVNVERASRSDRALAVTSDNWDVDQFLLGTPEGTVDLKTGLLNPSQPTDGITKAAAVAPAESADCPLWLSFLHVIEGCLDWQKNGLMRPESVKLATEQYFDDQDSFAQWLEDACDVEVGNFDKWEKSAPLFEAWSAYALKSGSTVAFAEEMAKRGFVKIKGRQGARWGGLRFLQAQRWDAD
jgi:phage/plasmid-associated DNA primase